MRCFAIDREEERASKGRISCCFYQDTFVDKAATSEADSRYDRAVRTEAGQMLTSCTDRHPHVGSKTLSYGVHHATGWVLPFNALICALVYFHMPDVVLVESTGGTK